jgi:multidrug efflux pump subunit AcrA (membrane-fusion protein)
MRRRPGGRLRASFGALLALVVLALMAVSFAAGLVAGTPPVTPSPPSPTASPARPTPTPRPTPTAIPTPEPGIGAAGVIIPRRSSSIAAPFTTTVEAVFVREGVQVREGQLLIRLDTSARRAAVNLAEAELRRARAATDRARVILDQLPDDASPEARQAAEADLRLAEAETEVAEQSLEEARAALRQTEFRAPFAGTVAELTVATGDQAIAGRAMVAIADDSEWRVETVDLSELDVLRVTVGDRALVTVPALGTDALEGVVEQVRVRGGIGGGNVQFDVIIRPLQHRPELRWNMSASVRILPAR